MGYEQILFDVSDGVAVITLNRPEKLNAFTGTMGEELWDAFCRSRDDDEVRAIVFTGAGRGFCAGVDLEALKNPSEGQKISKAPFVGEFARAMYDCPKPSICAMNGASIGVGVTMAVSFDIRIAAEDAKLAVPFVKLGILAGFSSTYLLPKLVGRGKTMELLLSGRTILGSEAAEIGLVNRAVPTDEVLPASLELAREMAGYDPLVVAHLKRLANVGAEGLDEARAAEVELGNSLRAARAERNAG